MASDPWTRRELIDEALDNFGILVWGQTVPAATCRGRRDARARRRMAAVAALGAHGPVDAPRRRKASARLARRAHQSGALACLDHRGRQARLSAHELRVVGRVRAQSSKME